MIRITDGLEKMIRMNKSEINRKTFVKVNPQDCSNCYYKNFRKGLYREREMIIAIRDANDKENVKAPVTREAILNCIRIARRELEQRGITVHARHIEAVFDKEKQTCGITYDSKLWANHDIRDLEKFIEEIAFVLEDVSTSGTLGNDSREQKDESVSRIPRFEAFMRRIWEA